MASSQQRAGGWPTTSAATSPAWAAGSSRPPTPPTPSNSPSPSRTPTEPGVYIDDVDGGAGSIRNKQERRRVMRKVYGDAIVERGGWVDLDRIDVEVEALLEHDAGAGRTVLPEPEARVGGRGVRCGGVAEARASRAKVPDQETVALGVDGARHRDALAVVATHVKTGYQWPVVILERPPYAAEDYEHDFDMVDGAVADVFERYLVWRCYCDDQHIRGWWRSGRTSTANAASSSGTPTGPGRSRGRSATTRTPSASGDVTTTATRRSRRTSAIRGGGCCQRPG